MQEVYIVSAKRTAIGSFLGSLKNFSATELGAICIEACWKAVLAKPHDIASVYFGNVLSAALGQAPARQAAIRGGLSVNTDCTTVNKVCASGMKALMLGAQQIAAGHEQLVMCGGMESMSNAPHYLHRRDHLKLGNEQINDALLKDGLTDAFDHSHMGSIAERCVKEFNLSREQQDDYALHSYTKAAAAVAAGKFENEMVKIKFNEKNKEHIVDEDEDIAKLNADKLPLLPAAFEKNGTITAANASNINDGAAAILIASKEAVEKYSLQPMARIVSYADGATAPEKFPIAPAVAVEKLLGKTNLSVGDIDFFELNEAYAAVVLANQKLTGFDLDKTNVYGGAVALGHPLGASGARIVCTLLSVLQQEKGRYGLAAICNGGGGASAMIIENLSALS